MIEWVESTRVVWMYRVKREGDLVACSRSPVEIKSLFAFLGPYRIRVEPDDMNFCATVDDGSDNWTDDCASFYHPESRDAQIEAIRWIQDRCEEIAQQARKARFSLEAV